MRVAAPTVADRGAARGGMGSGSTGAMADCPSNTAPQSPTPSCLPTVARSTRCRVRGAGRPSFSRTRKALIHAVGRTRLAPLPPATTSAAIRPVHWLRVGPSLATEGYQKCGAPSSSGWGEERPRSHRRRVRDSPARRRSLEQGCARDEPLCPVSDQERASATSRAGQRWCGFGGEGCAGARRNCMHGIHIIFIFICKIIYITYI